MNNCLCFDKNLIWKKKTLNYSDYMVLISGIFKNWNSIHFSYSSMGLEWIQHE